MQHTSYTDRTTTDRKTHNIKQTGRTTTYIYTTGQRHTKADRTHSNIDRRSIYIQNKDRCAHI